ncbi:MAG: putative Sensor histidine kinase [Nitrospira sp.]|nr:putative Sensor histidine kinase [Nitrospira sp.]
MYSLARFSLLEMTECSAVLRQLGEQSSSLRDAASRAVDYLFATLGNPDTGERDCVLVRCFKTTSYSRLDPVTQHWAREKMGGIVPLPDLKCLTLIATAGEQPGWNLVDQSYRYRVIPMGSPDFVKQFPMFSQLLHQFGISAEFNVPAQEEWLVDVEEKTYNVFYVPEAAGSPYVPVQEEFVLKYGVKSVLCFGGMLPSRDLFAVILFSRTAVPRETATLCRSLALSMKTSLLAFDETDPPETTGDRRLQTEPAEAMPKQGVIIRRQSREAVAEQLLRVYENAVRTQSAGMKQAQQALRERADALERAEQALLEQNRIANSILRSMGDGVVVTDGEGQLVVANPAVEAILGFSPGDVSPAEWPQRYEFLHADTETPFQLQEWPLARALRGEKIDGLEVYVRSSHNGPGRWISINARSIEDADDALRGTVAVFHDITWLKRAQDALLESEYRFRSLVEGARDIIFTLSADSILTSLNPAFETVTNWSRSQWIGEPLAALLHPDDAGFCQDVVQAILERGAPLTCSMQITMRHGGYVIGEFVGTPQLQQGLVVGVLGIIRDVTERRRIEDALRVSEERLRSIVQSTKDAIVLVNALMKVVFWNKGAESTFGYSADEIIGQPLTIIIPERYHEKLEGNVQRVRLVERLHMTSHTMELVGRRKEGTEFPLELSLSSWKGKADLFFTVIMRDISERRAAEEELDRLHRHNQVVLNSAGEGIYGVDRDGRLTFVNPAAAKMFGWEPEALIGQTLHRLVYQTDPNGIPFVEQPCRIMETISVGELREHVDSTFWRKDGTSFPVEYVSTPIRERGHIVGAVVVFKDTTDRKRAEEQLQDSLRRLRELSRRMEGIREEERGRIARELHDELGVGLTCLKIDLSRLGGLLGERLAQQDRAKADERIRGMKEQVDSTITSVQRLVAELRPGVLDDLGLVAAIEWQCRDFQRRTGIICDCAVSHEDLRVDPEHATAVFRICQEALTNVTRHAQATEVHVHLEDRDLGLVLRVSDNGRGIPRDRLADSKSFGLLGMRERAELLGGEVQITTRAGEGTTIVLCLPR